MDSPRKRVCDNCNEELSLKAYYRHQAKCRPQSEQCLSTQLSCEEPACVSVSDSSEIDYDDFAVASSDSDSSFCLDSNELHSENDDCCDDDEDSLYMENQQGDAMSESELSLPGFNSSSDSEMTLPSDDDEIWDVSDSDSDANESSSTHKNTNTVSNVIRGMSLFLALFHLMFRISEKAMVTLLSFLRILFSHLASLCQVSLLSDLATSIPRSLYGIRKFLKHTNEYTVYVVCPRCAKLYQIPDCVVTVRGQEESMVCDHIEFPHHPHSNQRSKCGTILMKRVKVGGKFKLVPRKTYVYCSVITAVEMMVQRGKFLEKCDHWRNRCSKEGIMGDIYDGKVWKDLHYVGGRPFLAIPGNICFALNIDWFNPFDETPYSAGAIYLVILNLPRKERYKTENTILVGMIPGPNEPKNHINTYLSPLVDDMCKLYKGCTFNSPLSMTSSTTIRAMIACITCDLPATRKVCGFTNFNATLGCSKCLKIFPTYRFGQKPDYGGFDYNNWVPRDLETHKRKGIESKNANTKSHRDEIAKEYGVKYSELLRLPEFNIIRFHVIDPMHNVFLGLAKHTVKLWKEMGLLRDLDYGVLQERVDFMNPPSKIGRIPRKIGCGFASFTADEWKNWILIYSMYALFEILPVEHYSCWCLLVECCRHLCQPVITTQNIEKAHKLIIEFCCKFESIYGRENCTSNMHMACHLKESIQDYGPLSSFWCFPFERYNGILEGTKKSWLNPEKQMFLKYLDLQLIRHCASAGDDTFVSDVCKETMISCSFVCSEKSSSLAQSFNPDDVVIKQIEHMHCRVDQIDASKKPFQQLIPPCKERCFDDSEIDILGQMYSLLYPACNLSISRFYLQYRKLLINEEEFLCDNSLSKRSSTIAAKWPGVLNIDPRGEAPLRIAKVHYYIVHNVVVTKNGVDSSLAHVLAKVSWYMDHPKRDYIHSSVIICATTFDNSSSSSFLPVARIAGRCAIANANIKFDFGEDKVNIAVPLLKNVPLSD